MNGHFSRGLLVHADFLIIGAGVIGLSSALELARRGARVTVLDKGGAGQESTWAGAGILSPLLPWQYPEAINALSEYSRALYPAWCEALHAASGVDPELRQTGMLILPPFDARAAEDWCERHAWRWALRPSREFLSHLGEEELLWLPDLRQARNPRLIQALKGAALAAGVRLVEHAQVSSLVAENGRVTKVMARGESHAAAAFVVAGGAWTGWIPGLEALRPRIFPVRGQILLFRLPAGRLGSVVYGEGQYLVPRVDGHVLAGSTLEPVGFDKATTEAARRDILAFVQRVLPEVGETDLVMQWSGLRPGSPDNVPCIGRHPDYANLYLNGGHFRYGVTMAPGSARLLASLIHGEATPIPASPYGLPGA